MITSSRNRWPEPANSEPAASWIRAPAESSSQISGMRLRQRDLAQARDLHLAGHAHRAGHDREVVGRHGDHAPVDLAVAGDDAVGRAPPCLASRAARSAGGRACRARRTCRRRSAARAARARSACPARAGARSSPRRRRASPSRGAPRGPPRASAAAAARPACPRRRGRGGLRSWPSLVESGSPTPTLPSARGVKQRRAVPRNRPSALPVARRKVILTPTTSNAPSTTASSRSQLENSPLLDGVAPTGSRNEHVEVEVDVDGAVVERVTT